MSKVPDQYLRPDFIELVNRLYHELEAETYDASHPEILHWERRRWDALLQRCEGSLRTPPRLLDVGTGTGFVPLQLLSRWPSAPIVCTDISTAMLQRAEVRIRERFPSGQVEFIQATPGALGEEHRDFDLITMNSVLHHLPEPWEILKLLARRLRPGGCIILSHEPNAPYYTNGECQRLTKRLINLRYHAGIYLDPRRYAAKLLRMARLIPPRKPSPSLIDQVMNRLRVDGAIRDVDFRPEWIPALVDFHIPRRSGLAGGERGLDPRNHPALAGVGLHVEHFEDYDHLADESMRTPLHRMLNGWLARRHPGCGAHFSAILRVGP